MLGHAGATLRRETGRLVEHDRRAVAVDHHRFGVGDLLLGQFDPARALALGIAPARGDADFLAGRDAIVGLGAPAIDPHLPGARPARDGGEAYLRQVPLEPAVEPDAVIVGRDRVGADFVLLVALDAHAAILNPANSARTPAATDPPI